MRDCSSPCFQACDSRHVRGHCFSLRTQHTKGKQEEEQRDAAQYQDNIVVVSVAVVILHDGIVAEGGSGGGYVVGESAPNDL